ncbi:MAG: PfkB family carbohydrate kinase [Pseudomonadota bacterium]
MGALAYDQIATTATVFPPPPAALRNSKLDQLQEQLGGCGGNLTYNLAQLGQTPLLVAAYGGTDGANYLAHLQAQGASQSGLLTCPGRCARAIIIADPNGDQFTGFYPGHVPTTDAWLAHLKSLTTQIAADATLLLAPYPAEMMLTTAQWASAHGLRLIWNPGQYADQLAARDIDAIATLSDWVIGNQHEITALAKLAPIHATCHTVQTGGAAPIEVRLAGRADLTTYPVPTVAAVDPTGCGDAFLAAFASQMQSRGWTTNSQQLQHAVQYGIHSASACLRCSGAQQHQLPTDQQP